MPDTLTDADFERLSFHDCHVWRIDLVAGDPAKGEWTNDLALGLDFIAEWLCGVDRHIRFRLAPAVLTFQGVTDPRIAIDWGDSGHQIALHLVSIDRIEREAITNQKVYLDRPYFRWRIVPNWPAGGEIAFGAAGFSLKLLAEPLVSDRQSLSLEERRRLLGAGHEGA